MTKAGPASVEFRNVSMRYGAVTAVDNVNFTIEAGKLVTLLGPSGCGKTTTLRMIAGFIAPSSGAITIGEQDVTNLPPWKRQSLKVPIPAAYRRRWLEPSTPRPNPAQRLSSPSDRA